MDSDPVNIDGTGTRIDLTGTGADLVGGIDQATLEEGFMEVLATVVFTDLVFDHISENE